MLVQESANILFCQAYVNAAHELWRRAANALCHAPLRANVKQALDKPGLEKKSFRRIHLCRARALRGCVQGAEREKGQ